MPNISGRHTNIRIAFTQWEIIFFALQFALTVWLFFICLYYVASFQRHPIVVRKAGVHSTDTGAWCRTAVASLHMTDEPLAAALAELFAGKSVLSLGEGRGDYRRLVLNASTQVLRYDAYDGAPFTEESTHGVVRYIDLTLPQFWLPRYDWVACLEVLEHIPASHESVVLDNVVRSAIHGVVLSWATPTQPGYGHVNARDPSYVEQTMRSRGLYFDLESTMKLRQAATLNWFKNHTIVYRKSPT